MKPLFLILLSIITLHSLWAQDLKPNEMKALVNVVVKDTKQDPIANETVIFISRKDKTEYMVSTNKTGQAQILLPKSQTYDVRYKDLIEKVKHSSLEIPSSRGKFTFDVTITFDPSDMVLIKGVSFKPDHSLEEGSELELEMMLEVLKSNPNMEIQIAVHSDNSESKLISKSKTEAQAKAIKEYFVKNGIEDHRIKSIGMGSDEPIAMNALPEGREQNNRVEIRVTKRYIE